MTDKEFEDGYPKFVLESGYVILSVETKLNTPDVHCQAIMRRLDTPRQRVGTVGSYSFNAEGEYEGIGDVSGEPGPECPQELLDGMKKIHTLFQEHWNE